MTRQSSFCNILHIVVVWIDRFWIFVFVGCWNVNNDAGRTLWLSTTLSGWGVLQVTDVGQVVPVQTSEKVQARISVIYGH